MRHITHVGFLAGETYCGIGLRDRVEGDRYFHMTYDPDVTLRDPDLCPGCRHIWDTCDEE